jgi:hypothetical protein
MLLENAEWCAKYVLGGKTVDYFKVTIREGLTRSNIDLLASQT